MWGGSPTLHRDQVPALTALLYVTGNVFFFAQVRVYTPPGLSSQGEFALDVAAKTLTFFADYFGEPYPLPKMDLVAVPDFAAGAMENWYVPFARAGMHARGAADLSANENTDGSVWGPHAGAWSRTGRCTCCTTRKSRRRAPSRTSPTSSATSSRTSGSAIWSPWSGGRTCGSTKARALALPRSPASPLSSSDTWGNAWAPAGFATYVGWLAVDRLFPEWDVWTQFLVQELIPGLRVRAALPSAPDPS